MWRNYDRNLAAYVQNVKQIKPENWSKAQRESARRHNFDWGVNSEGLKFLCQQSHVAWTQMH